MISAAPAAGSAAHLLGLLRGLGSICRGAAWEAALALGPASDQDGVPVVSLFGGAITLGCRWSVGEVDTDHLTDTAEIIDGLPFVRLEHVVAYKRLADRPKDREHLRLLAKPDEG